MTHISGHLLQCVEKLRSGFGEFHDAGPDKFDLIAGDGFAAIMQIGMVTEKYPGEEARTLLPLTRLVLELVAWAREAPEIKPGRK